MPLDPRTPVIVGTGQLVRHPERADDLPEPAQMMAEVLRAAADDAKAPSLLSRADSVRVVGQMSRRWVNPALAVAELVGASPRDTVRTTVGGNSPGLLLNDTATAIAAGEMEVALLCGVEAIFTRRLARRQGVTLDWGHQPDDTASPRILGDDRDGTHEAESARGLAIPIQYYPLFENALRAAQGETVEEHQRKIADLWARFSEVSAANPYAWSPGARTAEQIATVSPANRMIGFPYPKLMNAIIEVDQAAALILCSVEAARAAGVPEDRWVFPLAGADAHDHFWVSERERLSESPAIAACGRAVFGHAGVGADDVGHIDLYSCFPVAVEVAAAALGFGLDRPLTVTGGLTFAGGPGNNYVTHAIATMVDVLRNDPGSIGMCTGNGWYLTKHSAGLYSTTPPSAPFRALSPQAEVDALPRRTPVVDYDGSVTIESFVVMFDRDAHPELGVIACLTDDGSRTWANSLDADIIGPLMQGELIGTRATVHPGGQITLD
jgi:acetyl-CoA C-acetyltransferase